MSRTVEIHIDELVLHGFSYGERYLISAAVERELTRLFTVEGIPPSFSGGETMPLINANNIQLSPGTRGGMIGRQIARSVYSSFTSNKVEQAAINNSSGANYTQATNQ